MNRVFHWFSSLRFRETHGSFARGVMAVRGLFAEHIALSIAIYDRRRAAMRAARDRRIAIELGRAARLLGAGARG